MVDALTGTDGGRVLPLPADRLRSLHDAVLAIDGGAYGDAAEVARLVTSVVAHASIALARPGA